MAPLEVADRAAVWSVPCPWSALQWVKNPIPLSQLSPLLLGCGNPGGTAASPEQLMMRPPPPAPPPAPPGLGPGMAPALAPGLAPGLSPGMDLLLSPGMDPGLSPGLGLSPDLMGLSPGLEGLPPGVAPGPLPEFSDPLLNDPRMPLHGIRISMTIGGEPRRKHGGGGQGGRRGYARWRAAGSGGVRAAPSACSPPGAGRCRAACLQRVHSYPPPSASSFPHPAGISAEQFDKVVEPQLIMMFRQRVQPQAKPPVVYVASVTPVPAGVTLAGRRRLQQGVAGQEWLQVVVVIGGPRPLKMYESAQRVIK